MNEWLRPSTLGEILDRTANLYRSRFLVFFGIASVPAGVVLGFAGAAVVLLAWVGMPGTGRPDPAALAAMGFGMIGLGFLALPLMIGANALSGAAMCHAASTLLAGERITMSAAFKEVWKRGWQYVGLYLLLAIIIAVVPMVAWMLMLAMMAVAAAAAHAGAGMAAVSGGLTLVAFVAIPVYAVWMLLRLCLAYPISVVEHAPVVDAIKRAWSLCMGTRGRMLVLFLLGMALTYIASLLLIVPMTVAMALIPGLNNPQHAQVVGTIMIVGIYGSSFAVQALTMPVYGIGLVLFYYDQRVRREGFDIELLMRQAGMTAAPAPVPELVPWMPAISSAADRPQPETASEDAAGATETVTDTAGGDGVDTAGGDGVSLQAIAAPPGLGPDSSTEPA